MADKKITALTELSATDKRGEDFLHIIDYGGGSSPVNKKISLTNLFNNINLDSHIYGASKTLEVGFGATTNAHLTVTTGSANNADGTVTINQDGVAFVDFLVKSLNSDSALSIDAGADTVTINGDSANLDFIVNGDTVAKMLFCDASSDVVGIGVAAPDTAYTLDVAATSGKGIKSAGGIDVTGVSTFTGNTTVTGNITCTGIEVVNGNEIITDSASAASLTVATTIFNMSANADKTITLAAGTEGQIKYFGMKAVDSGNKVRLHPVTSGASTLQGANVYIDFDAAGEGATLMYKDSKWNIIGLAQATPAAS